MKKRTTVMIDVELLELMTKGGYSYSTVINMALKHFLGIKAEREKGLTSKQQEMKQRKEENEAQAVKIREEQNALWREEEAYCKSKGIPFVAPSGYTPVLSDDSNESESREEMIARMSAKSAEFWQENGYFAETKKRMMGRKFKRDVELDVKDIEHLEEEEKITAEEAQKLYDLSGEKLASFAGFEEMYD